MAYELPADGSGPKRLRTSSVASEVPVASEIQDEEILLNLSDGLMYFKDSSGAVASMGVASTSKVAGLDAALSGKVSGTSVTAIVALTGAEYGALSPPVSTTLYLITDADVADGTHSVFIGEQAIASYNSNQTPP